MARIRFRLNNGLKTDDSNKEYPIYIRVTIGRKVDFKGSIGFKVSPKDWNAERQRIRDRIHIHHRQDANELMDRLTIYFREYINEKWKKGIIPTAKQCRKHFNAYFKAPVATEKINLWDYIDQVIKSPETQRNLTAGSIHNYQLTKDFLMRFNNEVYRFDFEDIDLDWYHDFVEWSEKKGYSKNYIGKHIKTLKTFLNRALEDKVTTNESHKSRRFITLREDTDNVYLNTEELAQLWELKLTGNLEKARDLFLIGAWTGLRVCDYNDLSKNDIVTIKDRDGNEMEMLKVRVKKTKKFNRDKVIIPLAPVVKSILKKYNGPPTGLRDQVINRKIKEVCKLAGIDNNVSKTGTTGGMERTRQQPKYKLVSNHTGRRSFCTNAYMAGIPAIDIMAISDHTTEKSFLKYIKASAEQKAIKMASNPFFQGQHLKKVK